MLKNEIRPLRRSVLIAENLRHADNCARVDRQWRRVSSGVWIDEIGGEVRYVSREEQLRGLASGTIVYLGWGWRVNEWARPEMLRARGFVTQEIHA